MTGVEPSSRGLLVPLSQQTLETLTERDPRLLGELVEAGVVHIDGGELVASAACLQLSRDLLCRGVDLRTICQVVLLGGRLGQQVADRLRAQVGQVEGLPEAQLELAVRVAALAASDMLLGAPTDSGSGRIIDARDVARPPLVPTQDR
jgi:hypothetical protein